MRLHAPDFQMREIGGDLIDLGSPVDPDAEFVFAFARRDEFVRFRIHIGVHSNGDRGFHSEGSSDFVDAGKLAFAFDIERVNAFLQCECDLLASFANARKGAAVSASTGFQNTEQLTAGDDIKTRAELCQQIENGEIGVCFDGVADEVV